MNLRLVKKIPYRVNKKVHSIGDFDLISKIRTVRAYGRHSSVSICTCCACSAFAKIYK
jgi:hypothetical protein